MGARATALIRARARHLARSLLGRSPRTVRLIVRFARKGPWPPTFVGAGTSLVVEGFPRSANSYVVKAFRLANPDANVASHLHAAGHVRLAAAQGVPTLVLVRDPRACVASWQQYHPEYTLSRNLREYLAFCRGVERVRDRVLIADFDSVTADLGGVIAALNDRFGTRFSVDVPPSEDVFDRITANQPRSHHDEQRVSRPSTARSSELVVPPGRRGRVARRLLRRCDEARAALLDGSPFDGDHARSPASSG